VQKEPEINIFTDPAPHDTPPTSPMGGGHKKKYQRDNSKHYEKSKF
jgi:hypothetical protein